VTSLLIKHATVLATMDDDGTELTDAGLYAVDGWIQQVGPTADLPEAADEVLDLSDHIVLPGLINTHHHFYQTLTRAVPGAQDTGLFDWLRRLYPIWARMTPEDVQVSTKVALAELALSGCTTSSDHLYLYPNGVSMGDQVQAAQTIGLRVHLARGSMSLGESEGGLPPDSVVEDEDVILTETQQSIEAFHDPKPGAMVRVVVAPCSPFSVTTDLMREAADLAREYRVHLHTHVAETLDEEQFCFGLCGMRPVELMEDLGWAGEDVWYAHGVFVDGPEIARMASAGTGVAHCPTSNMRLASGIAPLREFLDTGVRTGLGVDGSASNDGSHMIGEARQAMLLARLAAAGEEGPFFSAREALRLATTGSAAVLGRTDIGSLEPGKAADFVAISLDRIGYAGALGDPVAAVLFAAPVGVDHTYVHGRAVVSGGELVGVDVPRLLEDHNAAAERLLG
jgi:cytosine/adenosine deaminase-related metal-dependent hydrolase